MAEIKANVAANDAAWAKLKTNVDQKMQTFDGYATSIENIALVYLLTGQQQYADSAEAWAQDLMANANVRGDSYLEFGDDMRKIALVLNYCGSALSAQQRTSLANYLAQWTNELWNNNQGSGWGLHDVGNNYYYAFLEGTAYAGYALQQAGDARGAPWIAFVANEIEKSGGVLDYLATRAAGGDWEEGVNYGERSKERMFSALSVIAAAGGKNYFNLSPFFAGSIYTAIYQLQPDGLSIYPGGDLARSSDMQVTPMDRDYVQEATFWLADPVARGYGQWYLNHIVPDYTGPGVDLHTAYFRDVLFTTNATECAQETLPGWYRAAGTQWLTARSAWDSSATCVSISAAPKIDQSHAHFDSGSFTMWKNGWQACDADTYSSSGLAWDPGAHNLVTVIGAERRDAVVPGLIESRQDSELSYAQIDATNLFVQGSSSTPMLNEYTRELVYLVPDTLVVYDRVSPKAGSDYRWRLHTPSKATFGSGRYSSTHSGGGISLVQLAGGAATLQADTDLQDGSSSAWRIEEAAPSSGRFLNVIQVGSNGAPALQAAALTSDATIQGAVVGDQVVVFSSRARGQAATLPFTYTVSGVGPRTHTLVNVGCGVSVSVSKTGGETKVTVAAGAQYAPDSAGVVRMNDS